MSPSSNIRQGDFLLVQFPLTDRTAAKLRPVLVVSANAYNRGEDIVVAPLSSSVNPDDQFSVVIEYGTDEFARSKIKVPSSIKWSKPLTISKSIARRTGGTATPTLLAEVLKNLQTVFS